MKHLGNIEIVNGTIIGAIIEPIDTLPAHDSGEGGRLIFNTTTKTLVLNDGDSYLSLLTDTASSDSLRASLGVNWITEALTFNPTDFNALTNITGLTSNSSLFNVISQLDSSISGSTVANLTDIGNVTVSGVTTGHLISYDGAKWVNLNINDIGGDILSLNLEQLGNVTITSPTDNDVLAYNGTEYVNKKVSYTEENLVSGTNFLITHNLGIQHCHVTVINPTNNQLITPTNITYTSSASLQLTLGSSMPVKVLVTAFS